MIRGHIDNALLASTHVALGMVAKVSIVFACGFAIGAAWYLLVGFRAGGI